MEPTAFGRRAVLKKEGSPDKSIEVGRSTGGSFWFKVDEITGPILRRYTPQQLMRGDTPAMTLHDAWRTVLSKYPDYAVTAEEENISA
jgi:hypothetical protein